LADATTISLVQQAALDHHRTVNRQLQHALDSRSAIEQAKGFLASTNGTDPSTAFEQLRAHARRHRIRLADLSRDVVAGTVTLLPPTAPANSQDTPDRRSRTRGTTDRDRYRRPWPPMHGPVSPPPRHPRNTTLPTTAPQPPRSVRPDPLHRIPQRRSPGLCCAQKTGEERAIPTPRAGREGP
ncbi:ANTAR domain-containing protein, partial [Streptomyces minutiscleroticus]|uniref:ANTAR domain-containing protein n=1 Tax=Streptomyces minutiscleroticus TaxID=68238 RepID=UPI0033200E0E